MFTNLAIVFGAHSVCMKPLGLSRPRAPSPGVPAGRLKVNYNPIYLGKLSY